MKYELLPHERLNLALDLARQARELRRGLVLLGGGEEQIDALGQAFEAGGEVLGIVGNRLGKSGHEAEVENLGQLCAAIRALDYLVEGGALKLAVCNPVRAQRRKNIRQAFVSCAQSLPEDLMAFIQAFFDQVDTSGEAGGGHRVSLSDELAEMLAHKRALDAMTQSIFERDGMANRREVGE